MRHSVRELQPWVILGKRVVPLCCAPCTHFCIALKEKTKKGAGHTNTNIGISCEVNIKTRYLLGKRENKTLKTGSAEIWS